MVRMIFAPVMQMDERKLIILASKLKPLSTSIIIEPSGRCKIIVETGQDAGNLAYWLKAKNYTHCKACNTLHFKDEFTCKDPFICLCGTPLNKIK